MVVGMTRREYPSLVLVVLVLLVLVMLVVAAHVLGVDCVSLQNTRDAGAVLVNMQ